MTKRLCDQIIPVLLLTLTGLPSFAQTGANDSLGKEFIQYQLQAYQEKVFVHVDRSFYLAGETIWFKVYAVDEYFNKPTANSGVAYVEVISKDQKPILQARIELKDGKGNGSFQIPASFLSGNYSLRAYTSWMKNFSPDLYFHQPLTVINTLNQAAAPSMLRDTLAAPAPTGDPTDLWFRDKADGRIRDKVDIQFFPEGGNLVAGLPSKLAFKAVNSRGKGVPCKGIIVDQKKDTVCRFEATRFGMGSFPFTPVKGDSYQARIEIGDSMIIKKLPVIYDQGTTMSLVDDDKNKLKIIIHSNMPPGDPTVYLFVHTRQLTKSIQAGFLANNEAGFSVDKSTLGEGISQFTIFSAARMPLCERLYFKQPAGQLRIETGMTQPAYGRRKKIDIDLSTMDVSGQPVKADMSLSVFWMDSLQSIPQENIFTWLLLTGDLKGKIESPDYYFQNSGAETAAAIDNLMLTQGWTRFRWEDVLENKRPYFEFLPEPDGPAINGKVIDKKTGQPAPPLTGYLSVPGRYFEFSTAISKPNGDIRFSIKKFYGNSEIIVQTNSQTDTNYRIDIANPFSESFASSSLPDGRSSTTGDGQSLFPEKWKKQLLYRSINAQVENTYRIGQKHRFLPVNREDTLPFYGIPDLQFYLDDYTRYTTIEEVIREYVLDVHLKQESGKYDFRIRNSLFNTFFDDAPLLLLDGMPVFDPGKILVMDPLKIKKIEVVSHRFYTNSLVTDGILSYYTYGGDLAGLPLDPNAVAIQYAGLQQQREFYTPVYDSPAQVQNPTPDFRNLLLWSPDVRTDGQGKKQLSFYTSDLTGTFVLVLQGITDDGLPGSTVRIFTVN